MWANEKWRTMSITEMDPIDFELQSLDAQMVNLQIVNLQIVNL